MKNLGLATILVFTLVACSPPQDQHAMKSIRIDKTQINIASSSVQILDPISGEKGLLLNVGHQGPDSNHILGTNWTCMLHGKLGEWVDRNLIHLVGRTVHFTDGQELLATGRILSGAQNQSLAEQWGFYVQVESPEASDKLYKRLRHAR
jgi:hypothetical protein